VLISAWAAPKILEMRSILSLPVENAVAMSPRNVSAFSSVVP
jgi:hypothetical protein